MGIRLRSARRTGARLAVTSIAAALSLAFAQNAHAVTTYSEDFEFGTTWSTGPGTGIDCTTANTGLCSLRVDPACCGTYGSASASLPVTSTTPIIPSATVSFVFKADGLYGDVDSGFTVKLDTGTVHLSITDGVFPNNGVTLYGSGSGVPVGAWPAAGTWITAKLAIDGLNDKVTATLSTGGTATASIAPNATRITGLDVFGVRWSTFGGGFNYDSIRVDFPS